MAQAHPSPASPERRRGREHAAENSIPRASILCLKATSDVGHWTLEPDGEIDLSNTNVLEEEIRRAERAGAEQITIDLRRVTFIDLSGVRAIAEADRRLKGRLRLLKARAPVQSAFRLTGTEAALPFED